jgi:hypothetical protein
MCEALRLQQEPSFALSSPVPPGMTSRFGRLVARQPSLPPRSRSAVPFEIVTAPVESARAPVHFVAPALPCEAWGRGADSVELSSA